MLRTGWLLNHIICNSGLRHYKIVVYIGSITSRNSNHIQHNSHYDVLTTTIKTGEVNKGEKWYMESVVIIHALVFFILQLTVQRIQMFF